MPDDPARALAQAEAYLGHDDSAGSCSAPPALRRRLMIVPASLAAIRAGCRHGSAGSASSPGVASLGTVAFLGMFAWMAWIAVASIVLLAARPRKAPGGGAPAAQRERGAEEAEEVAAGHGGDLLARSSRAPAVASSSAG